MLKQLIVESLTKFGWKMENPDSKIQVATMPVMTFVGVQQVVINPIQVDEDGVHYLSANFVSRGENALRSCRAYVSETDLNIEDKLKQFHEDVLKGISNAFSVRVLRH